MVCQPVGQVGCITSCILERHIVQVDPYGRLNKIQGNKEQAFRANRYLAQIKFCKYKGHRYKEGTLYGAWQGKAPNPDPWRAEPFY